MEQTIEQRNKALVLEAFDTLFNRKDFAAAEKFWSPNYIQHSAHIPPGRNGLFDLVRSALELLGDGNGDGVGLRMVPVGKRLWPFTSLTGGL